MLVLCHYFMLFYRQTDSKDAVVFIDNKFLFLVCRHRGGGGYYFGQVKENISLFLSLSLCVCIFAQHNNKTKKKTQMKSQGKLIRTIGSLARALSIQISMHVHHFHYMQPSSESMQHLDSFF